MIWKKLLRDFLIYLTIAAFIKLFAIIIWYSFSHHTGDNTPLYNFLVNSLIAIMTICFIRYAIPRQPGQVSFNDSIAKNSLIGLVIVVAILGGSFVLLLWSGQMGDIILSKNNISYMIWGLGACIAIGTTEELLVRKYLLNILLESYLKPTALIVSALIFALLHIPNPNINLLSILNLFLAGIILGRLYLLYHNIWLTIIIHSVWDFILGPVLGFSLSGIRFHSWIVQDKTVNNIWNGGRVGFEGSLLCLIAQLFILFLFFNPWKKANSFWNLFSHTCSIS